MTIFSKLIKYLLAYRTVTVLSEKTTRRYHFRFGKLISQESATTLSPSHQDDVFLINDFPQDLQEGVAPPLKYFDRFRYMAQLLEQRFETNHWVGYRWLKNRRYLLGHVAPLSRHNPPSLFASTGLLVGELCRYPLFEQGTGLIIVPQEEGVRQIYIRHHVPVFSRFTKGETVDWEKEIEKLKRHLERYHQAALTGLPVLWWSPIPPPLLAFLPHKGLSFERAMVQSAAQHLWPALPCYPQLPSALFSKPLFARFTLKALQGLSVIGLLGCGVTLSSLFIFSSHTPVSHSIDKIKISQLDQELKHLLTQSPPHLIPITHTYKHFVPNSLKGQRPSLFVLLKKLKPLLQPACQLQEIFWGRGQTQIDPKDLTMTFTPDTLDKRFFRQTLVLALSAETIQLLQNQQHSLKAVLTPHPVTLWEIQQESITATLSSEKPVSALMQYQESQP